MKYSFILKDNNQKAYNLFTWFLFFLHMAAAMFALNTDDFKLKLSIYIMLGFYALLSMVYYICRKHPKALETFSLIMALMYANFWFQQAGILAAIAFAAVFIIVTVVKGKTTTVLITDEGIHLTRVFKTVVFPWTAMENLVLKDNVLTIDFKTNKIIQVEIVENNRMVDETEFNLFCKERISH
ncbi:MAG: hypothetical protein ACKOU7_03990 [Ferruginibacter sp.]